MSSYAQHADGLVGQDEMAEKRRISEVLKQIADCQAMVMGNLSVWLRCRHEISPTGRILRDGSPKTAAQALERLVNARQEENRLFRELLGIADEQLKISKS